MPTSSSMIVSCAVALSFAAAVSAGAQIDNAASLHRIVRRQSHGIERAADDLVARSVDKKAEGRQVVECGQGLQIALSSSASADEIVRACSYKVKRTVESRAKMRRSAKTQEDAEDEEQKRWVLTDWIGEDESQDQDTSYSALDLKEDEDAEEEEAPVAEKKKSTSKDSDKLKDDAEDNATKAEAEETAEDGNDDDYEEDSYAPYNEHVYAYAVEVIGAADQDDTTTSSKKAEKTTSASIKSAARTASASTMTAPSSTARTDRKHVEIDSTSADKVAATTSSRGAAFDVIDLHDASADTRDPTDTLTRRALPDDAIVKPTAPAVVAAAAAVQDPKQGEKAAAAKHEKDDDEEDFDILGKIGSVFGLNRSNDPAKSSRVVAQAAPTGIERRWGERGHGDARGHAHDAAKRWAEDLAKARARRGVSSNQEKMALVVKRNNVYDRYSSTGRRVKRAE